MLYVSRYIGSDSYGVVDTDDNKEDRVSYSELVSACEKLGICVAGVASHYFDLSSRRITIVDSVMAYQVPEMRSPLQVKTDVMLHVNMVTHQSMITNILWDGAKISTPPVIRLSDYGDCCGDRILSGNDLSEVHQITLILDNKVKFTPKTFRLFGNEHRWSVGVDGVGILFDLRELTDNDSAKLIYSAVMVDEVFDDLCLESIIDSEARKRRMKQELSRFSSN